MSSGRPGSAEDLLGDVWAVAFESRGTYDRSFAGARPWLYGVALNRLRQYWRSRPAEDLVPDVTGLASGWDPWPAVDVRVDAQAVLRAAVVGLRPEEREVPGQPGRHRRRPGLTTSGTRHRGLSRA
jgi:DNA-directed RNA polymerase specialized sigma24 family protein